MIQKRPVTPDDKFELSGQGARQLQSSKTELSPGELELLVLIDGRSSVAEISGRLSSTRPDAAIRVLSGLLERDLITCAATEDGDSLDFTGFFNVTSAPSAAEMAAAGGEAATGASSLQQQGYYVRIARAAGKRRALAGGQSLAVVIIEDEAHLARLLKSYLELEGFDARVAGNRAEILAELRRAPLPDLVLLDVMLPDADGFDILAAIRRHPALSGVPVVMLTAKSTREAVLKGLAGGADGYITKPFEMDVLMKALRAVLGLPES